MRIRAGAHQRDACAGRTRRVQSHHQIPDAGRGVPRTDMLHQSGKGACSYQMMLRRALQAETLKMKRTIALKMVVLAPLAVVLLTVFMASQAPFSTLRRRAATDDWRALARVNFQFWGLLMMPLYITLQTALIAGLDHSENQWKALFARPVPRWTVYVAKLLVVLAMTAASGAVLLFGVLVAG